MDNNIKETSFILNRELGDVNKHTISDRHRDLIESIYDCKEFLLFNL